MACIFTLEERGEFIMDTSQTMAVLIAVTTGLVQVAKLVDEDEKLKRFYPLFALAVGFSLSFWVGKLDILGSLIVPLSSMGLYSGVKRTVQDK